MTLQFFIMGEPKSSMTISMRKTEKPRPMNSGEPKGSETSPAAQFAAALGMGLISSIPRRLRFR